MNEYLLLWSPEYSEQTALSLVPLIEESIAQWVSKVYAQINEHVRKHPYQQTVILLEGFAIRSGGEPIQVDGQAVFGLKVVRRFTKDDHAELVCYLGPESFIKWVADWISVNAKEVATRKKSELIITEEYLQR